MQTGGAFCAVCHLGRCYGTMVGGQVRLLRGRGLLVHLYHSHVVAPGYLQQIRTIRAPLFNNAPAPEREMSRAGSSVCGGIKGRFLSVRAFCNIGRRTPCCHTSKSYMEQDRWDFSCKAHKCRMSSSNAWFMIDQNLLLQNCSASSQHPQYSRDMLPSDGRQ